MSSDHRRHRRIFSLSRRKTHRAEDVISKFLAIEPSEGSFTTAYLVTKLALESESVADKLRYSQTAQYLFETGINQLFAFKASSYYNSPVFSCDARFPPGHDLFDEGHASLSSVSTVGTSILLDKALPAPPVESVVALPDSAGGFKPYNTPDQPSSSQSNLNPQPMLFRIKSSKLPTPGAALSTMVDSDGSTAVGHSLPNLADHHAAKSILSKRNNSVDDIDVRKANQQHLEPSHCEQADYLRSLSSDAVKGLAITYEPPQPPPIQQLPPDPVSDPRSGTFGEEKEGLEERHSTSTRSLSSSTFSSVFSFHDERPPVISPRVDSKHSNYINRLRSGEYGDSAVIAIADRVEFSSPYLTSPEMQQHSSVTGRPQSDPISLQQESGVNLSHLNTRLKKIAEVVDSEEKFMNDMVIVRDVFLKKLLNEPFFGYVCEQDITILASNIEEVIQLSHHFVEDLKAAIPSIVLDPNRDMASMSSAELEALQGLKTNIGDAILNYLPKMENAFTTYCNNNSQQTATFNRIVKLASPAVVRWLTESKEECKRLSTNAHTMDMFIVKPVQRLLKYPLFLSELLQLTGEDHPDYDILRIATEQMQLCADRVNTADREEFTTASMDTFPNAAIALLNSKMETLLQDLHADFVLEELVSIFDDKKDHIKDLMRSIQANTMQIQRHFDNNGRLAKSWLSWVMATGDTPPPLRPESEGSLQDLQKKTSRLKRYKHYTLFTSPFTSSSSNQVSTSILTEKIQRKVLEPLESVWDTYRRTETLIRDRQKSHASFVRYVKWQQAVNSPMAALHTIPAKPDSQTKNEADLFIKYHNSLKDGLPELFNLSSEMVELCMRRFVSIQQEWFRLAADSLANVFQIKVDDIKDLSGDDKDPVLNRFRKTIGARYYNLDALSIIQGVEIEEENRSFSFDDSRSDYALGYERSNSPSKRSHAKVPSSVSTPTLAFDATQGSVHSSSMPQNSKKSTRTSSSATSDREKVVRSKPSLLSLSAWQRSSSPKKK